MHEFTRKGHEDIVGRDVPHLPLHNMSATPEELFEQIIETLRPRIGQLENNSRYSLYFVPKTEEERSTVIKAGEKLCESATNLWPNMTTGVDLVRGGQEIVLSLFKTTDPNTVKTLKRGIFD